MREALDLRAGKVGVGVCGFCLMTNQTDRLYIRRLVCVCVCLRPLQEMRSGFIRMKCFLLLLIESLPENWATLKSRDVWKEL